jgi:hypothetical protein
LDELYIILHHNVEIFPLPLESLIQLLLENGFEFINGSSEALILLKKLMILSLDVLVVLNAPCKMVDRAVEHILHRFVLFVEEVSEKIPHGFAPILLILRHPPNCAWSIVRIPFTG